MKGKIKIRLPGFVSRGAIDITPWLQQAGQTNTLSVEEADLLAAAVKAGIEEALSPKYILQVRQQAAQVQLGKIRAALKAAQDKDRAKPAMVVAQMDLTPPHGQPAENRG